MIRRNLFPLSVVLSALLAGPSSAAEPPAAWAHSQTVTPKAGGLAEVRLPAETLDKALPDLRDVRLFDPSGVETPYVIDQPERPQPVWVRAEAFVARMEEGRTILTGRLSAPGPVDVLKLDAAGDDFLKSVTLEAREGGAWRTLVRDRPVFRRRFIDESMELVFPARRVAEFRLTVDDGKTAAVPFTAVSARTAARPATGAEEAALTVTAREEGPVTTRLTLSLPARGLFIDEIVVETPEAVFQRSALVVVRRMGVGEGPDALILEDILGAETIHRWPAAGGHGAKRVEATAISLGKRVAARKIVLTIVNGDSPPLTVTRVKARVLPTRLLFHAGGRREYRLAVGHPTAPAAAYDLASLRVALGRAARGPAAAGPLRANPSYKPPEVLPDLPETAAPLRVDPWGYRAAVTVSAPGVQRLELPPFVLSRAAADGRDLRLVRDGLQVPFIYDRRPVYRTLDPGVRPVEKAPQGVTRWEILLPSEGLPVTHLECRAADRFFSRPAVLYEERASEGGEKRRVSLGQSRWTRSGTENGRLLLALGNPPAGEKFFLEVENGDNTPLTINNFRLHYRTYGIVFKAVPGTPVALHYGNPKASFPRYDAALVADRLLSADKSEAGLGAEEKLRPSHRWFGGSGAGGAAFWVVLAAVSLLLLGLIAKLLPASDGVGGQRGGPPPSS